MPAARGKPDPASRERYRRWTFATTKDTSKLTFEERQVEAARWRVVFAAQDHATAHALVVSCGLCRAMREYEQAVTALDAAARKEAKR